MNKQELMNWIETSRTMIKKLDFTDVSDDDRADYLQTLMYKLFGEAEELISELKEPGKVKVPPYMKEFLDYCKKEEQSGVDAYHDLFNICSSWPKEKILKWAFEYPYRFINAFQYGYEVEEEPRYRVNIGGLYLREPLGDTNDFTIRMTWNENYAYPFDSWNKAREHISKLGGTIEKV